jgi:hypothetical protein
MAKSNRTERGEPGPSAAKFVCHPAGDQLAIIKKALPIKDRENGFGKKIHA